MVPNDALTKILRAKKFRYKDQTDRMTVWKKQGSTDRVLVRRNQSHDVEYARILLRQAGCTQEEVENFFKSIAN